MVSIFFHICGKNPHIIFLILIWNCSSDNTLSMSWLIAYRIHFHANQRQLYFNYLSLKICSHGKAATMQSFRNSKQIGKFLLCFLLCIHCKPQTIQIFHVSQRANSFQFLEFCPQDARAIFHLHSFSWVMFCSQGQEQYFIFKSKK